MLLPSNITTMEKARVVVHCGWGKLGVRKEGNGSVYATSFHWACSSYLASIFILFGFN